MGRFAVDVRWPGVASAALGEKYHLLEQGLNGRTTVWDDPLATWLPPNDDPAVCNGIKSLMPILHSVKPVTHVVIALGCNDLKARFSVTPIDIANGVSVLVDKVRKAEAGQDSLTPPKVIIVCPPPIISEAYFEDFAGGIVKSQQLARHYKRVADEKECTFVDAGALEGMEMSTVDGIHLTARGHAVLGAAIAAAIDPEVATTAEGGAAKKQRTE